MIPTPYRILLVDDHPLITYVYENAFIDFQKAHDLVFQIDTAHSFVAALNTLDRNTYDLVFLDIQMPTLEPEGLYSGEDLGARIRTQNPNTKIVIITTFNDNFRIHSIIEQVSPDGFLIKNDLTPQDLAQAIHHILYEPPYYSKTVVQSMRQFISNDFILDKTDRKILYYLSRGATLHEIGDILALSRATIAKRKQLLKEVFNVTGADTLALLEKAREKGFI